MSSSGDFGAARTSHDHVFCPFHPSAFILSYSPRLTAKSAMSKPGTKKIFDASERFYTLLLERVGEMAREGKSVDQIKKELRKPGYDDWTAKKRFGTNVEAAYRTVQK